MDYDNDKTYDEQLRYIDTHGSLYHAEFAHAKTISTSCPPLSDFWQYLSVILFLVVRLNVAVIKLEPTH